MSSTRRQYPFDLIEAKWQAIWARQQTFRAWNPGEPIPADHPFAQRHPGAARSAAPVLPPKYYVLDMFPYPSGAGLHVGHPEGYTATDMLARYKRACGFNVLHPMGWDAFGLPAEQYAIKTGQHPRQTTEANIANFKRQIQSLGFSYDWSREVDTTDPAYFKWTQWIFLQLYNAWYNPATRRAEPIATLPVPPELRTEDEQRAYRDGKRLAYVAEAPVNWCPQLGTVLANEEVIDGKSEVGGFPVIRRPMRQWMLRITAYAERLLEGLAGIDWSESLKEMQRNWIGRSEGAEVKFSIVREPGSGTAEAKPAPDDGITVFTTRPDTLFGATYMVLSPEHKLVNEITTAAQRPAVKDYQAFAATRSDLERTELAKEKTGVFTGAYAVNPVNHERIPIWIADYVLISYGTGAIMAVPAHDTRDLEFARKFNLPIVQVVQPPDPKTDWHGYVDDGLAINSTSAEIAITGLPTPEAKQKITAWLESNGWGKKTINYKLRDWLFSRQRYWGEPFPIIWKNGRHEALPEHALPVLPPPLDDYKPTPDGQPPLARARDWVNLPDGATRETNTMPQWAGSCWYYLRYLEANNAHAAVGKAAERYWMGALAVPGAPVVAGTARPTPGVDLYVGGAEHAVLHLLYARFWHKVLYDLGYVTTPEPFHKLVNQGLILGENGQKMSKSLGNVINPDAILTEYGADAFRLYEMFMGPLEMVKPWNTKGVEGVYRFLGRVWRLWVDDQSQTEFEQAQTAGTQSPPALLDHLRLRADLEEIEPTPAQLRVLHAAIKKVTEDLDNLRFNTAISALMVFVNEAMAWPVKPRAVLREFLVLLQPFAPHLAEELYQKLGAPAASARSRRGEEAEGDAPTGLGGEPKAPATLAYVPWPKADPQWLTADTLEIPVQVNGKLRDRLVLPIEATAEAIEAAAQASDKVRPYLEGKTIRRVIVVPRKLVNIVAN